MKYDLHVHSTFSDGADTVAEVMDFAKESGIELLSFVDHDTTDTYKAAKPLAEERQIQLISGIEISAYDFKRKRKVHVLGYGYNQYPRHINEICDDLLERRHQKSLDQLGKIEAAGYKVDYGKLMAAVNKKRTLYKQHIMAAITDAPYESEEYQNLYRSLFKGEGVAAGDIEYIDVFLAVKAIKADGGQAVIAHPGQLNSFELIEELVPYGLDGVEVYHPDHSKADIAKAKEYADKNKLIKTGGSDYHGVFWTSKDLGSKELSNESIQNLLTP